MKRLFRAVGVLITSALPMGSVLATDYSIGETTATTFSNVLPVMASAKTAVTQQIYLASELTSQGASNGTINGITFYYGGKSNNTAVSSVTRSIRIYLMEADDAAYTVSSYTKNSSTQWLETFVCDGEHTAGTWVYEGDITTEAIEAGTKKALRIEFNKSNFEWDGSKNLVLTVYDVTGSSFSDTNLRFVYTATPTPRFVHDYWISDDAVSNVNSVISDLSNHQGCLSTTSTKYPNTQTGQEDYHKLVNVVTFSIIPSIPQPTDLTESNISSSSATIGWTAAAGAESYEVRYGTTSGNLGAATNVGNITSYTLSDFEDETTYYYQVRTKIGSDYSTWTEERSFTTLAAAAHTHNGITFSKWTSTTAMPTSGNYYLANNIQLSGNVTLTGDLNICLNGNTIYTETYQITIPDEKTMAIYDSEGNGRIYGYWVAAYPNYAIINIQTGGTLVLSEGSIENLYGSYEDSENSENSDNKSLSNAIYNNGILKLSGSPTLTSYNADIYLGSGKVITIESGKPLTNSIPYSVYTPGQVVTSGWANMGGAVPSDYLTSVKSGYGGVCLNPAGEVQLVRALSLDDTQNNNSTLSNGTYYNTLLNFTLSGRTFTSASFNTLCLPFALTDEQLQTVFGAGYDLEEFVSSELNDEELMLAFSRVTSLTAGQPYLIRPTADVVNPTFEGVTITTTSPARTATTNVDLVGIFTPTTLEQGNRNLLFLGANNTLFWNNTTNDIYGFRAYFEIKEGAARQAVRARIVQAEQTPTDLRTIQDGQEQNAKAIENGQLIIRRNSEVYNALGKRIR